MRIVHVLASFEVGGGETVALSLAARQHAQGHHVVVVALGAPYGPMAERFRAAEVAVRVIAKGPGLDWTLFPRLYEVFVRERAEVVHTHNPQSLVYAAPAGRAARCRVVHTKHGDSQDAPRRMWLRRQAATLVDAFVSVSRKTEEHARRVGEGPLDRLHVIENGVDLTRFRPDPEAGPALRAELGLPPGTRLVGSVGRLAEVKNHALLLRATAPLLGPEVRPILLGEGDERAALSDLAALLGRSAEVHLLGQRRDVPRVMAALDLFVLSSRNEGLPLVVIEAMATGIPVISTAVGGVPDVVVSGETGLLVSDDDALALRAAIERLLVDRELAQRLGARGRERVLTRYSLDQMVSRYEALYLGQGVKAGGAGA